MSLDAATKEQISSLIDDNEVLLFMKGNRAQPQCGFSATVVQILNTLVPGYTTVDVLSDPAIREGIKVFSSWPTIPQLYLRGEFIGGCDIIQELFASGELHEKLGIALGEVATPRIEVSDAAADALRQAMEQAGRPGGALRLGIDASYQYSLSMGEPNPGDLQLQSNGAHLILDPLSASRADGIRIDHTSGPGGTGFTVDNPNAPKVRDISVRDLKKMLDAGHGFEFLDVRTPEERATASITGSVLMSDVEAERLASLPRDRVLVFHCHHGGRSKAAADHFAALGFVEVYNVTGGIDAWSQEVDSDVPRY